MSIHLNGKMRFYCCLLIVSFVIDASIATNKTNTNNSNVEVKANNVNAESKNKRQITQYLRTPGTNEQASFGAHQQPQQQPQSQPFEQSQALPLQLSHTIYGQEHGSHVFSRRPTPKRDRQVIETVDDGEQEPQQQQQHREQQSVLPSYYNYGPDIGDGGDDGTQIDSRNLPAEARNKLQQTYSSSQSHHVQMSFTPITPKSATLNSHLTQNDPGQSPINDDDYLDLIRNTEFGKSDTQAPNSKTSFAYVSASPSTPIQSAYDFGPTNKSPFSQSHRYSPRGQVQVQVSSTPSSHLQQQFNRQSVQQQQFYQQPTAAAIHESYSAFDKDSSARIPLKKLQEPKPKYSDPSRGQYHQEVSIKPTKKVVSFKPSYQFSQPQYTAASQTSSTPIIPTAQSQPLHYQNVQHFAPDETIINMAPGGNSQPQRQYSFVLPQTNGQNIQQAYYQQQQQQQLNNSPFQGEYYAQGESFTSGGYQSQGNFEEQSNAPQHPSEIKPTSEIRFQFVHPGTQSPTPTPTPTPARIKYVPENLKYELYDSNGHINIPKENPTVKLNGSPQHLHRPLYIENHPQYMKKLKVQPQHGHYGPHAQVVRLQNYQQTPQPTQKSSVQSQSDDILGPIQPSRASFYAAQSPSENPENTGRASSLLQSATAEKQTISSDHQTNTAINDDASQVRKQLTSLAITSPKKPISQAEFETLQKQALAQGIQIQAIPVPVPVLIPSDRYRQLQQQQQQQQHQQQREQFQQSHGNGHTQSIQTAHHHHAAQSNRPQATGTHYIRYHPKQQESEEGILTSYLRPLMEYIGGPSKP